MADYPSFVCFTCKLKERCDWELMCEAVNKGVLIAGANENGCPQYKSILTKEVNDKFKRALKDEIILIRTMINEMEKECGPQKPSENMDFESFKKAYNAWDSKFLYYTALPMESKIVDEYLDFLKKYGDSKEDIEVAKKHKEEYSQILPEAISEILKAYREYGISGAGAQNEKIHEYALSEQKRHEEYIAAMKAEKERERQEQMRIAAEERKRKELEKKQKAEAEKQKRAEARKKEQQEYEERRKRLELEEAEENKKNRKKALIFWGIYAVAALILVGNCEEWWEYALVIIGLIIAAGVRIFIRMMI